MTRTEHLLSCLAEECAEVAQRTTKALRFGLLEVQADQPFSNAERIAQEVNDLIAIVELLEECGAVPRNQAIADIDDIDRKKAKVQRWLDYSRECGTLTDATPGSSAV